MKLNKICPLLGALIFCLLSCNVNKKETSFKLTGNLTGVKGEGIAILQDYGTYTEDTVPFIDGKFEFTGKQDQPKLCRLYFIGPDDSLVTQFKSDLLYIENATITCTGSYSDMMYYVENSDPSLKRMHIEGGQLNEIYNFYLDETRSIVNQAVQISNQLEYSKIPVENMTNKQYESMLLKQMQLDSLLNLRNSVKDNYIQKYADTQLAYDFVCASIVMDYHYEEWIDENRAHGYRYPEDLPVPGTAKVDKWISLLKKQNTFTQAQLETLNELANKCKKLEPGALFIDGMVNTTQGDSVSLGSVFKEGRYTLIDCWASWCHPCRASIPHLKQLNEKYKDKGLSIVGLSLDATSMKKAWLKAVEDEGMDWPQYQVDYDSKLLKEYNIAAIPNIILITPDKKILKTGVRGFDLDIILKNTFGF